jgi:excisionase family DNA binding protein
MSSQNGALASASERLRDVQGFPKRPGRPRKISTTPLNADVPQRRQRIARGVAISKPLPLEVPVGSPAPIDVRPALPPRLLGPKSAGAYLGVSAWTARQLVERREIRLVKLPGIVRWLVDRADLDALIEKAKASR